MKTEIFDFQDYKKYLRNVIVVSPNGGRGKKTKFAQVSRCQPAYVSQVLKGNAHFSLEQAEAISRFIGHTAFENHYFLLLVQHGRAGTKMLRRYFEHQLKECRQTKNRFKDRILNQGALSQEQKAIYYSAWYFSAVHVLITISDVQTPENISYYLGLPIDKVFEVLHFLTSANLAESVGSTYKPKNTLIHLEDDSPFIISHHKNWRLRSVESLLSCGFKSLDKQLHYSSVVSLSKQDASHIRQHLMKEIEQIKNTIRKSREEELYSFCLDFFSLDPSVR